MSIYQKKLSLYKNTVDRLYSYLLTIQSHPFAVEFKVHFNGKIKFNRRIVDIEIQQKTFNHKR